MLKLTLNKGQKIWFSSDFHYNHTNICMGISRWTDKRGCRNYDSLEVMNREIIDNINAVVGADDILIFIGDWSFGGFNSIKELRDQLICQNIYFFCGNHDHHVKKDKEGIKSLFTYVEDKFDILYLKVPKEDGSFDKYRFFICHFPLTSWEDMSQGVMHLHGHMHNPTKHRVGAGRKLDVGIDGHPNRKPYELHEVLKLIFNRPIKSGLEYDHHDEM